MDFDDEDRGGISKLLRVSCWGLITNEWEKEKEGETFG